MTVQVHDEIDLVAVAPDGRMVLNMREDRIAAEVDPAVLREDFRRQLAGECHDGDECGDSGVWDRVETTTPTRFGTRVGVVLADQCGATVRS